MKIDSVKCKEVFSYKTTITRGFSRVVVEQCQLVFECLFLLEKVHIRNSLKNYYLSDMLTRIYHCYHQIFLN